MNQDILKVHILSIALTGLMVLLTGIALYFFRDHISDKARFFMPLPPISVAAYIFVFNLYRYHDGNLPGGFSLAAKEILIATVLSALAFGIFTALLVLIIEIANR